MGSPWAWPLWMGAFVFGKWYSSTLIAAGFPCKTVSAGAQAALEASHCNWRALKMETFATGSRDSQELVSSTGCYNSHSSPAQINVRRLALRQNGKMGETDRDSPPVWKTPTTKVSFELKIFKVATHMTLIGWCIPPLCTKRTWMQYTHTHIYSGFVSQTHCSVHLIDKYNGRFITHHLRLVRK